MSLKVGVSVGVSAKDYVAPSNGRGIYSQRIGTLSREEQAELINAHKRLERVSAELIIAEAAVRQKTASHQKALEERIKATAEADQATAEADQATAEADQAIAEADQATIQRQKTEQAYNDSVAKAQATQAKLDQIVAAKKVLAKDIAQSDAKIAVHDAKIAVHDAKIAAHDAKIAAHDAKIADIQAQKNDAKQLREKLAARKAEILARQAAKQQVVAT